jgi:hypothetical protein
LPPVGTTRSTPPAWPTPINHAGWRGGGVLANRAVLERTGIPRLNDEPVCWPDGWIEGWLGCWGQDGRDAQRQHPVRPSLSRDSLSCGEIGLAGGEPGRGIGVTDALVGPVAVVFGDPRVDRGLDRQDVLERWAVVEQLPAQALVEPLDLARRGR